MTTAAALRLVPSAFTVMVPVPWPPASAPHVFHVMDVIVTAPVAHPTVIVAGRMCGVEDGPQERTDGTDDAADVVVLDPVVVVPWAAPPLVPWVPDLSDDEGD